MRLASLLLTCSNTSSVCTMTSHPMPKAMAKGRREARQFTGGKSSTWSGLVRRKWLVPRSRLVSALERAERAAADGDP